MTRTRMLTISSLLSTFLLSIHLSQDALLEKRGTWSAGPGNLVAIAILFFLLSGPTLLSGRRSGYVIMLLGGIFAVAMPVLHLTGGRFNPERHSDALLFMWILIALGVTGLFSVILAIQSIRGMKVSNIR